MFAVTHFAGEHSRMPKGPLVASQSTPNPQSLPKRSYSAPQFNHLTPAQAKAKLKSAGQGDAAAKQLLERIAQLEARMPRRK